VRVHISAKWIFTDVPFSKNFKGSCPDYLETCTSDLKSLALTVLNWSDWLVHCAHTDRTTSNENSISAIHFVHLAEITTKINDPLLLISIWLTVGRQQGHSKCPVEISPVLWCEKLHKANERWKKQKNYKLPFHSTTQIQCASSVTNVHHKFRTAAETHKIVLKYHIRQLVDRQHINSTKFLYHVSQNFQLDSTQ